MIDIQSESVVSLADAVRYVPKRRGGKKVHISTLFRWSTCGCRGQKLETIQAGATRCTSVEALQRFFNRLSGSLIETSQPPTRQRKRDYEADAKKLVAAGFEVPDLN